MWNNIVLVVIFALISTACQKEQASVPEAPQIPLAQPPQNLPAQTPAISGDAPVVISEAVRQRWKAVILLIDDKESDTSKEYTVLLRDKLLIPDSNVTIKVNEFLPDLKIEGNTFTSGSDELLNPSVHIQVIEKGDEIFSGWLFQLFPTVHPLRHDRFNIILQAPVSAS